MRDSEKYKVDLPEGKSGVWEIRRFTVNAEEAQFGRLRAALTGRGRYVPEGSYTALCRNGQFIMTDTPDEIHDHSYPIYTASGHCLINGLGLGLVANGCLMNDDVQRVTVIELSQDVINLVAPHYLEKWGDRFEVINADAFTYTPPKGVRYGMVWHDIWDNICSDNLPEMAKLHRKHGRRCEWQGSWAKHLCKRGR